MNKSLIDYLKKVPDFRDPRGCRHPLWLVLLIMIMGIISGHWGYRPLGRFVERHRRQIIKSLSISQAIVPSYSTIRRVMLEVDYQELEKAFNQWAQQEIKLPTGEWIAGDGKSLRNTVSDYSAAQQNFITMVSLFSHHKGLVRGIKVMENKAQSEIKALQDLLEILNLHEKIFTLDALHCQKKLL